MNYSSIRQLIEPELLQFNREFEETLKVDLPVLQSAINYFLQKRGKQLRPLLTILAAKTIANDLSSDTIAASVALELIHNASLIHDDVVDETFERRGVASLNAKLNNKMSVLVGDYFLSIALQKAIGASDRLIANEVAVFARAASLGEINQLNTARTAFYSEENYYQIIYDKTAALFVACVKCGAIAALADEKQLRALADFGKYFGLCFQIRDDIFDYYPSSTEIGKPTGNDIREGKITLPLLHALSKNTDESLIAKDIIHDQTHTPDAVEYLIEFAKNNGGVEYAYERMNEFSQKALAALIVLPQSRFREALEELLKYSIERTY